MDRQEREEYREHVRTFGDALRASLAAKRGVTLEDLQQKRGEDAEENRQGEGERRDEG